MKIPEYMTRNSMLRNQWAKWEANPKSRAMAIKMKCLDCSCGQPVEIKNCTMKDCALYNFRPYKQKVDKESNPIQKYP